MKTLVAVVLGCLLISSKAHTQPAASAGSTTEQFVLKSDGTLVPVAGADGASTAAQSGTTGAAPQASPRTTTPIAAPKASSPSAPANSSRAISAASVASSGTIADPESTSAAQAVAAARQALNNKQFAQLSSFVPKARGDILAIYPEYWAVRTKVWSYNAVGAREEIQSFLEKYKGSYLEDRLRTDWILMAARQGDFGIVRELGAVRQSSSNVSCAQL
jgi:soluble lytic murein transglycosylase